MSKYIDYDAARERLLAITTDSAIIDRLMGLRQADKSAQLCLSALHGADMSLDYVLFGHGEPLLPKSKSKSPSSQPRRDNNN